MGLQCLYIQNAKQTNGHLREDHDQKHQHQRRHVLAGEEWWQPVGHSCGHRWSRWEEEAVQPECQGGCHSVSKEQKHIPAKPNRWVIWTQIPQVLTRKIELIFMLCLVMGFTVYRFFFVKNVYFCFWKPVSCVSLFFFSVQLSNRVSFVNPKVVRCFEKKLSRVYKYARKCKEVLKNQIVWNARKATGFSFSKCSLMQLLLI